MAEAALDSKSATTKPSLEQELRGLLRRASKMEDVLRGAHGILHSINSGGLLDHLPRDEVYHKDHNAGLAMLELLKLSLDRVLNDEDEEMWWLSCDICRLGDQAAKGTLARYTYHPE